MESALIVKSTEFARIIIKITSEIQKNKREFTLSRQLARAGTSICANIAEAKYAQSKADFINKLCIARKETNESLKWIELIGTANLVDKTTTVESTLMCTEILKILTASIKTLRKNSLIRS